MQRQLRSPWLAFAALVVGFELPTLLIPEPLRPSGEPFVLAALWLAGAELRHGRWLRGAVAAAGTLLMLHRLDRAGFFLFLGDEPLLYDQLFFVRHLLVLIADLWNFKVALALLAAFVAVAAAALAFRRLLRGLVLPEALRARRVQVATPVFGSLLILSLFSVGGASPVRWASQALLVDVQRSLHIYRTVQQQIGASPYAALAKVELRRKPDVYLVLVESYGRVMLENPAMSRSWLERMRVTQQRLGDAGWHMASSYTRAPVLGGRSWLAEATLLTGMHVAYQAVFAHLMANIERVPNLVRFFDRQGYYTVLLGPADRARAGVKIENYYGYDRAVHYLDLGYTGPKIGWGIVPDQYSLWHTHEHVLRAAPRPLFFNFHTVTPHAPWEPPPKIAADWRTLGDGSTVPHVDPKRGSPFAMLRRFLRGTVSFADMGELRADMGQRYATTVVYTLKVLEDYLAQLPGDALVIVMGDHQPGFVTSGTPSFDSPIHVFARDPRLLEELRAQGFQNGLLLGAHDPAALTHEGLFSLLVRALARCCSSPQPALPAYLRSGVPLGS